MIATYIKIHKPIDQFDKNASLRNTVPLALLPLGLFQALST